MAQLAFSDAQALEEDPVDTAHVTGCSNRESTSDDGEDKEPRKGGKVQDADKARNGSLGQQMTATLTGKAQPGSPRDPDPLTVLMQHWLYFDNKDLDTVERMGVGSHMLQLWEANKHELDQCYVKIGDCLADNVRERLQEMQPATGKVSARNWRLCMIFTWASIMYFGIAVLASALVYRNKPYKAFLEVPLWGTRPSLGGWVGLPNRGTPPLHLTTNSAFWVPARPPPPLQRMLSSRTWKTYGVWHGVIFAFCAVAEFSLAPYHTPACPVQARVVSEHGTPLAIVFWRYSLQLRMKARNVGRACARGAGLIL